jgi:hypothetical protein
MKNSFLLLALSVHFSAITFGQNPVFIASEISHNVQNQQDWICNFAGTFEVGTFIGQSTDTDLDTIYLCLGDSIFIDHNGDAVLTGDPYPITEPGVSWALYQCLPTIEGDNLQQILMETCLLEGAVSGMWIYPTINAEGDTWLVNSGLMQTTFNAEQPLLMRFAPITVDNAQFLGFESSAIGAPIGPCVHVNVEEAFEVVYLNGIGVTNVSNNSGDDCLGSFIVQGGYPQDNLLETYDIDISLVSDPTVHAQLLTAQSDLLHGDSVLFSVVEPGAYLITIEDGKSCGLQFQIDMSGCTAFNNIGLEFGEVAGGSIGESVCVPLRVENFDISDSELSVCWDSNLLKFIDIENLHPAVADFFGPDSYKLITPADLRLTIVDAINGTTISIPDGEVIFDICLEVLDTIHNCTAIGLCNTVSSIIFEDSLGLNLAVKGLPGGVCKSVTISDVEDLEISKIFPNPVKAGESAYLNLVTSENTMGSLLISNAQGAMVQAREVELSAGENHIAFSTAGFSQGLYFMTFVEEGRPLKVYKLLVF